MADNPPLHWSLVLVASLFLLMLSALVLSNGLDEISVLVGLRVSSLTTALPFLLVFSLEPSLRFRPLLGLGHWIQQHQRDLWVVAGVSHLIHLGQIGLYYKLGQSCPLLVWAVTAPLWIILTLSALAAMFQPSWLAPRTARTSIFRSPSSGFPSAQTKAVVYQICGGYVWLVFTLAFVMGAATNHLLFYNLPAAALFLAVGLVRLLSRGLTLFR